MSTPSPSPTVHGRPLLAVRLGLLAVASAACLVVSAFHFGLTASIAGATLVEPAVLPAAIVEGAIGIALAVALGAWLTSLAWARTATIGAYAFGIVGFLIGITAVARDRGLQTPFNVGVHVAVFPLLLAGLALEALAGRMRRGRPTAG